MAKLLGLLIVMAVAAFITAMILRKDLRFDVLNFLRRLFLKISKSVTENLDKPQARPVVIDKDPNKTPDKTVIEELKRKPAANPYHDDVPTVDKDGEVKNPNDLSSWMA